jgi:hypothetical protein
VALAVTIFSFSKFEDTGHIVEIFSKPTCAVNLNFFY